MWSSASDFNVNIVNLVIQIIDMYRIRSRNYSGCRVKMAVTIIAFSSLFCFSSCKSQNNVHKNMNVTRPLRDTVGFAQYPWQMDSIMARIGRTGWKKAEGVSWRLAICPHDDYTYVGKLYPELLQNIKAPNIILLGVAHRAAQLNIEDSLVFDTYKYWKGPWKDILVSPARDEIYSRLKGKYAVISDSLQKVEHSVEAMIPFLQYFDRDISIVPILVPAMSSDRMEKCGKALAEAIGSVAEKHNWIWGRDYAVVVTTDAVHYGNEDWGGSNYAFYGCDDKGNVLARAHEAEIIDSCLVGPVTPSRIRLFSSYTLDPVDYHKYKWTWCGRYSVPVALYTSFYLNNATPLSGELTGYSTSITSDHIPVDDIGMGRTAIATDCHWVGYAALGFK
jgi:AmmeMemoRadiSam system protein B